jgi:hypothetical protein
MRLHGLVLNYLNTETTLFQCLENRTDAKSIRDAGKAVQGLHDLRPILVLMYIHDMLHGYTTMKRYH